MRKPRWIKEAPIAEPGPHNKVARLKSELKVSVLTLWRETRHNILWAIVVCLGALGVNRTPWMDSWPELGKVFAVPVVGMLLLLAVFFALVFVIAVVLLVACLIWLAVANPTPDQLKSGILLPPLHQPPPEA